ncbi:MAG: allophanate hydrolase [Steroidobacteraceae bacterium]
MSVSLALDIASLQRAYAHEGLTPTALLNELFTRIERHADRGIWIQLCEREELLAHARRLETLDPASLPLYGVPFAIKDNIDLAGVPTTAGCPAYAYTPSGSATVVQKLLDAGALPLGKCNLDQFATGLVGTRSPYGVCRNAFDPQYLSGGSSSGSAVAVALGLASFSLGTDTAGSGRVPAAFNNLVGLKPTLGRFSNRGMVPACRSIDALSVFALCASDAARVARIAEGFDAADSYSRLAQPGFAPGWLSQSSWRFGVPHTQQLEFFGNAGYRELYQRSLARLEQLGGTRVEIDLEPLLEVARLLYEGPWLAERLTVVADLLRTRPDSLYPVTRTIIEAAKGRSAEDSFRAQYRLMELKRSAADLWRQIDVLVTPTAGSIFTIEAVLADPIRLNSQLGHYTNFVNLLDLSAVAVPAGFGADGLPGGITLLAQAWQDNVLLALAARVHAAAGVKAGATPHALPDETDYDWLAAEQRIPIAVCGAHLAGLPLNPQLTARGAAFVRRTRSAPEYRLYALPGGPPYRPGMVHVAGGGGAIELEVWSLPAAGFGSFVAAIPAPLGIGKVKLADGSEVPGFVCESQAVTQARDITSFGGWRAYLARASG